MKLESLWIYPVKSCQGIEVKELQISQGIPTWDRHWMIVDEAGQFQSQRKISKMALIGAALTDRSLILTIEGQKFEVELAKASGPERLVKVWNDTVPADAESDEISKALSEFIGKKVFLVRSRPQQRNYGIRFSDSRPIQLANLKSLEALNSQLSEKISIRRFRPNIIVSGLEAFAEFKQQEFAIGELKFQFSKPCIRCNIINIDPDTGVSPNNEPLKVLTKYHPIDGKPAFGVLLLPLNEGNLSL